MRTAWTEGTPFRPFHRHGPTWNRAKYQALAQGIAGRGERPFRSHRGENEVLTPATGAGRRPAAAALSPAAEAPERNPGTEWCNLPPLR
jgi:hypothetical protein